MVQKIPAGNPGEDFRTWLQRIVEIGCSYEVVIEGNLITRVYVREADDGNWENIGHGRVFGTKMLSFKQRVFLPRLVDGKFIADHNG